MMNYEEAIRRVTALDQWVCRYPRSNTFGQFQTEYAALDPELQDFLDKSKRGEWPQELIDALNSLGESVDMGQFLESPDRPWRRISEGPSYGNSRDDMLDDLFATLPGDYQVSAIREVFDPIKERLHSDEWIGKPRREQLDWLDRELQGLISRIQTPESAAVVHAYCLNSSTGMTSRGPIWMPLLRGACSRALDSFIAPFAEAAYVCPLPARSGHRPTFKLSG